MYSSERPDDLPEVVEVERELRRQAELALARSRFLSASSATFAGSFDYEQALRAIADAAVPSVADRCVVDLIDGDGLKLVAIGDIDPGRADRTRELRRRHAAKSHEGSGAMNVIKTGLPQLHTELSELRFTGQARDAGDQELTQDLASHSAVVVPIRAGGVAVGVISFTIANSRRRYGDDDLAMAVQLGDLAGTAMSNARLYDDAIAAVRMNETFSAIVGHDLRNPLAAIVATAHLMMARQRDAADVRSLRRILSSSDRMARMIDELLDFTRVRAGGGMPSDPQPMDLETLCKQVIYEIGVANPDAEITFDTRGSLTGVWDEDRLGQLLSNLISNAVHHGSDKRVEIVADGTVSDTVRVTVANTGAIPQELAANIFEPFRSKRYRHTRASGLGLGLYIARQIALVHGGDIELGESQSNETSFTMTLPRHSR